MPSSTVSVSFAINANETTDPQNKDNSRSSTSPRHQDPTENHAMHLPLTRPLAFIAACLLGYWASLLQQLPAQASPENHLQERILSAAAAQPLLMCCAGLLWYALLREHERNG